MSAREALFILETLSAFMAIQLVCFLAWWIVGKEAGFRFALVAVVLSGLALVAVGYTGLAVLEALP